MFLNVETNPKLLPNLLTLVCKHHIYVARCLKENPSFLGGLSLHLNHLIG